MKRISLAVAVLVFCASSVMAQSGKMTASGTAQPAKKAAPMPAKSAKMAQPVKMVQPDPKETSSYMTYPGVETTTDDIVVGTEKNKKGTLDYEMMERTQTSPQGVRTVEGAAMMDYTPSKAALFNEKKVEASIGVGGSYSFNKDANDLRYSNMGLAGTAQVLWDIGSHFSLGADYMLLAPHNKTNYVPGSTTTYKHEKLRLSQIGLAGKYTINAWDTWRVYIPMGVGAANVRLASNGYDGTDYLSESANKWGVGLFAGLGVQYDICQDWFMGVEYRYSYAFIKDTKVTDFGRDKNFQFHSAFLRIGTRF